MKLILVWLACSAMAMAQNVLVAHITPTAGMLSVAGWQESVVGAAGSSVIHRAEMDVAARVYSGYDLLLEPQPDRLSSRVTFQPLTMGASVLPPDVWTATPLADYPAPKIVHAGDTIEVIVLPRSNTHPQVVDTITFVPSTPRLSAEEMRKRSIEDHVLIPVRVVPAPVRVNNLPKIDGPAHEFSGQADELNVVQPVANFNDIITANSYLTVNGALPWFYFPGHGRYILSLLPRQEFGFKQAGEVRGGQIAFTLDGNSVTIDCASLIVPGIFAYNLYVLRDPDWQPTSSDQRRRFVIGSIAAAELSLI
jgi:hypothetical protein